MQPRPWRFFRLPLPQPRGHWLQVLEAGPADAPTLLLLHGGAGSWHNFRPQIEWLEQSYRVLVPDLRGHGVSPWPGDPGVDGFVQDVEGLVEALIPGPFAVIAHSFGGCLAAHLAAGPHGRRVRGLCLCNTAGEFPRSPLYHLLCQVGHLSHWVAQVNPYWLSVHGSVCKDLLRITLRRWNVWELLPQLPMPALVVAGKLDHMIPWESARRTAQLLPDAVFVSLENGRHVPMWEQPQLLRGHWESWLSRLDWSTP